MTIIDAIRKIIYDKRRISFKQEAYRNIMRVTVLDIRTNITWSDSCRIEASDEVILTTIGRANQGLTATLNKKS